MKAKKANRLLSVVLTIVVTFTMLYVDCEVANAIDEESEIKSINLTLPEELVQISETDGRWKTDSTGEMYYYYDIQNKILQDGAELTICFQDGNEKKYNLIWAEDTVQGIPDWRFESEDGSYISLGNKDNFLILTNQEEVHWTPGNTYDITVKHKGKTTSIPVNIIENPVQAIRIDVSKGIELIGEAGGYWERDENGEEFYNYYYSTICRKVFASDNTFVITDAEGNEKTYNATIKDGEGGLLSADGDWISIDGDEVRINGKQWETHWLIGNTYEVEIEYKGKTTTVPVKIVENPVDSISLTIPNVVKIVEKTDGHWLTNEEGEKWYCYCPAIWEGIFANGTKLVVNNTDGSNEIYTLQQSENGEAEFLSKNGKRISLEDSSLVITSPGEEEHKYWTVGNTYDVIVEYMGRPATIPVSIVKEKDKPSSDSSYIPPVLPQKPIISADDGYTVNLSSDGKSATIIVKEGYELLDVIVNSVSRGAVTTLTNLKTGDKVEIKVNKKDEELSEVEKVQAELGKVTKSNFKARSKLVKMKSGKTAIKIICKNTSGVKFDGVQIFRSLKKNSGYGKKPIYTSKSGKYYNTSIKKGKRYYYKTRGYIEVDGVKYYSSWSAKAWRTAK